jgi:hypothetical protein
VLRQALSELDEAPPDPTPSIGIRHARLSEEAAARFSDRMEELVDEFDQEVDPDGAVFGLVYAVYPTSWPAVPGRGADPDRAS